MSEQITAIHRWKMYFNSFYISMPQFKHIWRDYMKHFRREAALERANAALQRRASAAEAEVARLRDTAYSWMSLWAETCDILGIPKESTPVAGNVYNVVDKLRRQANHE